MTRGHLSKIAHDSKILELSSVYVVDIIYWIYYNCFFIMIGFLHDGIGSKIQEWR